MTTFARITVTEEHGIRRFLYPLKVVLPSKQDGGFDLAARDEGGGLIPCEAHRTRNKVTVLFALSLGPYERKKITLFRSEVKAPVPDPIAAATLEDGTIVSRQERITTTLRASSELISVVYDGVEHLAGPVVFTLNAEKSADDLIRSRSTGGDLAVQMSAWRRYPAHERLSRTDVALTACKSWAGLTHIVEDPSPGSVLSLDIPLTPPGEQETPTCDFGLGNGVYCKIDGDDVAFEADFYGKKPYCCWQISRLHEGVQRVDYQGDALTVKALSQALYFHWTVSGRSLAVAITDLPSTVTRIQALLGRSGRVHVSAVLGDRPVRTARLGAVLHFLNAVPAIAAATNPASILCPPTVKVRV